MLRCVRVHLFCLHPSQVCVASSRSLEAAAAATANIALPKSVGNRFKAAYHYVECEADFLVEPDNTQDVADAVKAYRQLAESQGAQLKIRASRRWVLQRPSNCSTLVCWPGHALWQLISTRLMDGAVYNQAPPAASASPPHRLFHSTTSFVCPNQFSSMPGNGSSARQQKTISVGVLQDKMNKTVSYDPAKHTMTIQAGMKLREFAAEATRVGMSVQVGSLPAYAGLTVGGVLSTSGHGSGDQATSNICDTLISLTWVDHQGNIRKSARKDKEGKMFCGGMGLIGLITELEVQLTPPTHTKLITRYLSNDTNLVDDIEKMLKVWSSSNHSGSSSSKALLAAAVGCVRGWVPMGDTTGLQQQQPGPQQ